MVTTQDFMQMNPLANMMKDFDITKVMDTCTQGMKMWQGVCGGSQNSNNNNWMGQMTNWQQDAYKQYNDYMKNWTEMCPVVGKGQGHNFADGCTFKAMMAAMTKNSQMMNQIAQAVTENTQGIIKRKAEIIQKQSSELFNLMKDMTAAPNPETTMSLQVDYVKKSFERMMNDFKELSEMAGKTGMKTFDTISKKVHEGVDNMQHAMGKGFDDNAHEKTSVSKKNK